MAHDIEGHVVINRPPADVWRWTVATPELEQQWRNLDGSGVQELELVGERPVREGSRFRGTVKMGWGRPQGYVNEVTALEEHREVSWRTIDAEGPLGGAGTYRLVPLDDGTRTRFEIMVRLFREAAEALRPVGLSPA